MNKLFKSRKALSPVIASIILVAVTVAVSIAVAAWMGALTFTFTKTEELKITSVTFPLSNTTALYVTNTGASTLTVSGVTIDGTPVATANLAYSGNFTSGTSGQSLPKGLNGVITITWTPTAWSSGVKYTFVVQTVAGNQYQYETTAGP